MSKRIRIVKFLKLRIWVCFFMLFLSEGASATKSSVKAASEAAIISNGIVICIDPGHQLHADNHLEADGPDSITRKPKVSAGTTGVATDKPEYVLNLEVSLLLRNQLKAKGYTVVMTREIHDVNISNKQRAEIANDAKADLFLRIHADGSDDSKIHGISVLYPSEKNPYTKQIYETSQRAAGKILDGLIDSTKASSRGTIARDDLSGFNWSKVPTVLVEMGFMSNADEDKMMSDKNYQFKLAAGMVDGIETYFQDYPVKDSEDKDVEPMDELLTLTKKITLYELKGSRLVPTSHAIAPQKVKVFEHMGTWYHIRTWLGDLWIDGGGSNILRGGTTNK